MLTIGDTRHVLAVPSLDRAEAFFAGVLGFEVEHWDDPGWRVFRCGAATIQCGECPDAAPPKTLGDHSYFATFIVDDVDAWHARLTAHGATPPAPQDKPWGLREMPVATPGGHRMLFAQPLGQR